MKSPFFVSLLCFLGLFSSCKVYDHIPADISNNIPTIVDLDNYYDTLSLGRTEEYVEDKWTLFIDRTGMLEYQFDNENDPFHR